MNMHHITKSLFVGAAIAGIGMSSGKAEITIPKSLRDEIRCVVEGRLKDCYQQVRNVIRDYDLWGAYREADTNLIYDLITNKRLGFFYFCSLEMMGEPYSFSTLKKDLRYFFEEQCPPYSQKVQFSNRRIERNALFLNRIIRSVIGEGDPFWLFRDYDKSSILAQKGIVDEDKYRFYFKHSFVFNDQFIETIARIIHNGMTIMNKMYEITGNKSFNHEPLKTYLMAVQGLYVRYLAIKNSPRDNITIGLCDKFIKEAECLGKYNYRISPLHRYVEFLLEDPNRKEEIKKEINAIYKNALSELKKWEMGVRGIRDELLCTDPVYWAPAPVSDEEGAEILKELEEQEDNHLVDEDAPNAFLEQID